MDDDNGDGNDDNDRTTEITVTMMRGEVTTEGVRQGHAYIVGRKF